VTNTSLLSKRRNIFIGLFLVIITLVVYWQVGNHEFVNFDDNRYVTENRFVTSGLTLESIFWAFSFKDKEGSYWQPLTWLSHMLDCQLFGLRPGRHHLTNLFFHLVNTVLLFWVLNQCTGVYWRSAFVAVLFGLHPINVESVAWVAARKNVLSTFFWMLTLLAYVYYAKRPCLTRYMLTFLCFTAGLMAKPMLVTLPFVLLLLDFWPLNRLQLGQFGGDDAVQTKQIVFFGCRIPPGFLLVLEKVPFIVLSFVLIHIIYLSLESHGGVISPEAAPVALRIANALVSYIVYIGKMLWPLKLAVLYPYPGELPVVQTVGAGFLLMCVSAAVLGAVRRRPYLLVGWLWYLGTLVPVIGLVQVGLWPSMADRFAYVPLIGLYILIAWGLPEIFPRWRHTKIWLAASATVLLTILMVTTWQQIQFWKNSVTLFEHALKVTSNNSLAHFNLGAALSKKGRIDEAVGHYSEALRIQPYYLSAHYNLGAVRTRQGRVDEAIEHYLTVLHINPDYAAAHTNLAIALIGKGKIEGAIYHFQEALRIKPNDVNAKNNLKNALQDQQKGQ